MKVVRELVKYVEPAEVYAGERRRDREIKSAGDSIVVRARRRPAVVPPAREEEPAVADPGPSARQTPQVKYVEPAEVYHQEKNRAPGGGYLHPVEQPASWAYRATGKHLMHLRCLVDNSYVR